MKRIIALVCAIAIMFTGLAYVPSEIKAEETTKISRGEKSKATIEVDDVEDFQSDHPYSSVTTDTTWVYKRTDAAEMKVTFSTKCSLEFGDFVYIYDQNNTLIEAYTDDELSGLVITIPGNTIKIHLATDESGNDYGFKVDQVVVMNSIKITSKPTYTSCLVNQEPYYGGISVVGYYENGTSKNITSSVKYSDIDTSTVGEKSVTISYYGLSTILTLYYVSPQLSNISSFTAPNKKQYMYGTEELDLTGILMYVKDTNGRTYRVTSGVTYTGYNSTYVGTQSIKWNYKGLTRSSTITVLSPVTYTTSNGVATVTGIADTSIENLSIPDTINGYIVQYIGSNAFKENTKIKTVTLPNTIKEIGSSAFYSCSNLVSISIQSGVSVIGTMAFARCSKVTEIEIPKSVESIGAKAFSGMIKLEKITVPFIGLSKTATNDNALFGRIFADNYTGTGTTQINQTYVNTSGSTSTVRNWIPSTLRHVVITTEDEVPSGAFCGFSMLESIYLNDRIVQVGRYAFDNVSSSLMIHANKGNYPYDYATENNMNVSSTSSIEVDYTEYEMYVTQSMKINATVYMFNGLEDTNPNIKWSSNSPSVISVDNEGLLTALSDGTATINISCEGKNASIKISSYIPVLKDISLNKDSIALDEGGSERLSVSYNPSYTTDSKEVTWESSDKNIATVDNTGKVEAVSKGTCRITVKGANNTSASCTVTVLKPATSIVFNQASYDVYAPNSITPQLVVTPSDTTDTITWTSSNTSVATVNSNGKLTTLHSGQTTITAKTSRGLKAECIVTVKRHVDSISISGNDSLFVGDSSSYTYLALPSDYTDSITWSSSDESILTVSTNGKVTGVSRGTAEVLATSENGVIGRKEISVKTPASNIVLSDTSLTMNKSEQYQLTAETQPIGADEFVTWRSSNTTIATVSTNGLVTAIKPGTVTIYAKTAKCSEGCVITVKSPAKSISISGDSSLYEGDSKNYSYTVNPSDCTDRITWSSSDESVLKIDQNGKVTGVSKGTAYVIATSENGVEERKKVNILKYATGINLSETNITVNKQKTYQLNATLTPTNADETVTWSSSNADIATVSSTGLVIGQKVGTAIIYAKTKNCTKACIVTVESPATSVSVSPTTENIFVGQSITLTKTFLPTDSTDIFTWSSSDNTVATVSNTGVVTGKKAGNANITVRSTSGKEATCLIIVRSDISLTTISAVSSVTYTGAAQKPTVSVLYNYRRIDSSYYEVSYKNNVSAGKATITVVGKGGCTGSQSATFDITPINSSELNIEYGSIDNFRYTSLPIELPIKVTSNVETLTEGKDYSVEYKDNVNVGRTNCKLYFTGNYSGSYAINFNINPRSINDAIIEGLKSNYDYTGNPIDPDFTIKYNEDVLVKGEDFTVSYLNNTAIGKAIVSIKAINPNYVGTRTTEFYIEKVPAIRVNVILSKNSYIYSSIANTPSVNVTYKGKKLTEQVDYDLKYRNNINAGKGIVRIVLKGKYEGTIEKRFDIKKYNIASADTYLSEDSYSYTGKKIKPEFWADNLSVSTIIPSSDYYLVYKNNKKCGWGTVTAYGKGNCYGKVVIRFRIKPKAKKSKIKLRAGTVKKIRVKASGKCKFKSKNKKIATVNKKGVVFGRRKGTTKIRITCNKQTTYVKVVVKKAKFTGVRYSAPRRSSTTSGRTTSAPQAVKKKKFIPKH